jgi:hypothetical protein
MDTTCVFARNGGAITQFSVLKHPDTNITVQPVRQFAFVFDPLRMRVVEINIVVMDFRVSNFLRISRFTFFNV